MTFTLMKKGMYVMPKEIKIDLNSIRKEFEKEDTSKNKLGLALVERAIFMRETLKKLEEKIEESGVVTEMCQGNYSIERANPAIQAYNGTLKNYTSTIKQLVDMLPEEIIEDDSFENFE